MKRAKILLTCFFVLILSLAVFAVSCTDQVETETTNTESVADRSTESETDPQDTDVTTETESTATQSTDVTTEESSETQGNTTHTSEITTDSDEDTTETAEPGSFDIPFDSLEETEANESETQLDPDVCPEHPNRYAYDMGYHWFPACETCGRETDSTPLAHTAYLTVEDEGDVILYSYFCRRCECAISRIEVPYDVNLYIDPVELGEAEHNFGTTATKFDSTLGVPAMKFTSENGQGNYVMAYSNENTAAPTGRWLVMKIKLNDGRASFRIDISSMEGKKSKTVTDGIVTASLTELHAGWTTVIVDLSKIAEGDAGYLPGSDGEYYLNKFKVRVDGASAMQKGENFEIAYVAFCDTLDDAKTFAADDYARYIFTDVLDNPVADQIDGTPCQHKFTFPDEASHSYGACDICGDNGGTFAHKYNFINVETNGNGEITQYQVKCNCGSMSNLKTVPADVNHYTVPSKIHFTNVWHGYTHGTVGLEDGDIYQRVYLSGNPENGHGGTIPVLGTGDLSNFATVKNGSGKYFVFKIRTHEIQLIALRLATREDGDLLTNPADGHPNAYSWTQYDGEWMTVVVDLRRLAATGKANQVSQYIVDNDDISKVTVGLQCQKTGGEAVEGYVDIAYFAICDTWEQIAEITGQEKVLVTSWAGSAPMAEATTDGNIQCDEHLPKLYMSEDRKTYSFRCSICDKAYDSKTFTTDINYYSAPSQQLNSWNTGGTGSNNARPGTLMVDEDGGFVYNRITLEKGGAFEFINDSTPTGKFLKGFSEAHDTVSGGSGKYMVIKMRVGTEDFIKLLAWDGVTGNETYYNAATGQLSSDSIFELVSRDTALNEDWAVYVIDIEKAFSASYSAGNADIKTATFGLKGDFTEGVVETDYVDIAYFAICDNWEEVADVVQDDEQAVIYTDWKTPFSDEIRRTDGTPTTLDQCQTHAATVMESMTENGVTTYRYVCPVCRYIYTTKLVSSDINYYAAPSAEIGYNSWNTGKMTSSAGHVGELMVYESAGQASFPYARITMQNGGAFEVLNGSVSVDWQSKGFNSVHDAISGSGKYMVIKMRVGANESSLNILAWDGETGYDAYVTEGTDENGNPKYTFASDRVFGMAGRSSSLYTDWTVYVIDMEKAFPSTYTTGNVDLSKATFGFKGDGNGGALSNGEWQNYDENDYVDIAYFAICDSWTEISSIVGSENVIYTDWKTPANDKNYTSSGTEITNPPCETHAELEYVKEVGSATTTYKYVCPECKNVLDLKEISNSVNYYVAPNKAAAYNNWASGGLGSFGGDAATLEYNESATEGNFTFARVKMNGGASFELHNGTGSPSYNWTGPAVNTINGSGRYAVMKIRLGSGMNGIKFGAWDGITGSNAIPSSSKHFDNGSWNVIVVDLSAFSSMYDAENAEVNTAMFGFMNCVGSGEYSEALQMHIDIAYFAVCDNWTEIAGVVGDDTTVILTDWKSTSNPDSTVDVAQKAQQEQ
ncbi:MAG: hypothetical protein E7649_04460 [Ruminococcaceae bacterium]|nr:hypothetical protein [Oscillospiraceae bacterium]